jgi:hypothetical protein
VVHALSLYLAEGAHALEHADAVEDLLILDGPLYPTEVLSWPDRESELRDLAAEATPRRVVENYLRLVERLLGRDVPVVGFVKNPSGAALTRALRRKGVEAPWPNDAALFGRLLERRENGERRTDQLTFTSWFVSRAGTDRALAAGGDAFGLDRRGDAETYEVTFMLVYDPRDDVLFRVEAPRGVTEQEEKRERLTRQVLHDVAVARGPPPAVAKADELARVGRGEKEALRRKFEERLDSDHVRTYDDVRWTPE